MAVAVTIFASAGAAHAQGIPVIDVSNLAQAILTVDNMVQSVETLKNQYDQMTTEYASITGNRGLGQILNDPTLSSYLPSSWQSIYSQVKSGNLNGISGLASQIESEEGLANGSTAAQQRYNDTLAANKAMAMQSYTAMEQRLQNIQNLMQQSDLTQDPAAKADLQNRLQAENAQIANEQTRLALVDRLGKIEKDLATRQADQEIRNQMTQ
jgi:type IV secretion system protein VirB5